jgi:hypothetical protein
MASSIFCCSNGWIAEKMKNNQNRSPIDMGLSFWHRRYQSRARLRPGSRLGSAVRIGPAAGQARIPL